MLPSIHCESPSPHLRESPTSPQLHNFMVNPFWPMVTSRRPPRTLLLLRPRFLPSARAQKLATLRREDWGRGAMGRKGSQGGHGPCDRKTFGLVVKCSKHTHTLCNLTVHIVAEHSFLLCIWLDVASLKPTAFQQDVLLRCR